MLLELKVTIPTNQQKGYSLLEVLITLVIVAILIVMLSNIMIMGIKSSLKIQARSQVREEISKIEKLIKQDLRNSANLGSDCTQEESCTIHKDSQVYKWYLCEGNRICRDTLDPNTNTFVPQFKSSSKIEIDQFSVQQISTATTPNASTMAITIIGGHSVESLDISNIYRQFIISPRTYHGLQSINTLNCKIVTVYEDNDRDGYGNPNGDTKTACPSEVWVDNDTDCDDNDSNIWRIVNVVIDRDQDGYRAPESNPTDICLGTHEVRSDRRYYKINDSEGFIWLDSSQSRGIDCDDNSYSDTNTCCEAETLYEDADGDGYGNPSNSSVMCATSGWVEDNTDCNDSLATEWRLRYRDGDNDGHCLNDSRTCVGNHTGYKDSCTSYSDCNDTNAHIYRQIPALVNDADNDGFSPNPGASTTLCVGESTLINNRTYYRSATGNFDRIAVTQAIDSRVDCHDNNANVRPNQGGCFTASYTTVGGGSSFDYNCNGSATKCGTHYNLSTTGTSDFFEVSCIGGSGNRRCGSRIWGSKYVTPMSPSCGQIAAICIGTRSFGGSCEADGRRCYKSGASDACSSISTGRQGCN
jgi:prepilin-type N-terminal cleavage/methylation domain-containing protein